MFDSLEARGRLLAQWPEGGMACPAIASDSTMFVEARQVIFDRVIPDGVQIVRMLPGARDVDCAPFLEGLERWVGAE